MSSEKDGSRPKQLAFGRAQARWNGTIELRQEYASSEEWKWRDQVDHGGQLCEFVCFTFRLEAGLDAARSETTVSGLGLVLAILQPERKCVYRF